jgi:hypothetical protein
MLDPNRLLVDKSERQSQDSSAAVADSLLVARGKAWGSSATV